MSNHTLFILFWVGLLLFVTSYILFKITIYVDTRHWHKMNNWQEWLNDRLTQLSIGLLLLGVGLAIGSTLWRAAQLFFFGTA